MTQQSPNQALVRSLVSYLPPAVARAIHSDPQPLQAPRHERVPAAVLLADVSGFTALTEALANYGAGGVEELTTLLNRYFSRMIGILEAAGGEVVQFSGDALMAMFPSSEDELPAAVSLAYTAAQAMQDSMAEFAQLATSVGERGLAMKIALGAGEVLAMSIGGIFSRWQYIIAGAPLVQVGEGEQWAQRGEIVLSPEARAMLARISGPVTPRPVTSPADLNWGHADELTLEALQLHIPRAITARLTDVEERWLAELRRMSVIFIGVGGLEETDDQAVTYFHTCMRALQEVTYRYEGSLNKFQVDDKGVIGVILFGAPPMAHADDALRAVRCALDLQQAADLLGLRMAIGVTTDQVFAGPVGSRTRREYTVMGDAVNLAARLMQKAGKSGILCDFPTYHAARAELHWDVLAPLTVKGKASPVRVYRPLGLTSAVEARSLRHGAGQPLIGREEELARLEEALGLVAGGQSRVLFIEGEEGIGKSRMIQELIRLMRERGVIGIIGAAESVERERPYNAWREIVATYFRLDQSDPGIAQHEQVLTRLNQIAPALAERAPLLNDILGLGLAETALTSGLEPVRRQESLRTLVVELLRLWTVEQPLVIILEDAHWLDALSWELAATVARSLSGTPLLLVCAYRVDLPPMAPGLVADLRAAANAEVIGLGPLTLDQTARLGAARLGVARLADDLAQLIAERAAGNPLVTEELALSLREKGAVSIEGDVGVLRRAADELQLPATLQSLVLSRIDHLPASEQFTLKVASVIGTSFSQEALREIYPEPISAEVLTTHLAALTERALIVSDNGVWTTHRFKQTVLREMTYGILLPTQRRDLHQRVAVWYENRPGEALGSVLPQLAHHWRHAGNRGRELRYTTLAARKFATEYANAAALSYIQRGLQLSPSPAERLDLLWLQLQIYELTGQRGAQHQNLEQIAALVGLSDTPVEQARLENAWAAYYRDMSDYPAALEHIAAAEMASRAANDAASTARSQTLRGEIYECQGAFTEARVCFEEALAVYRKIGYTRGEANNLSKLGNLSSYLGAFSTARDLFLEVLALRRSIQDASECFTLSNLGEMAFKLGDWDEARAYWEQAFAAARRIGDRNTEALVLGQMGYSDLARGRYSAAIEALGRSIQAFRAIGERRREAESLNDLGMAWRDIGGYTQARQCFEEALNIQQRIGDTRGAIFTSLNLGWLLLDQDPAAANDHYQQAHAHAQASGDRDGEAYTHSYLAYLAERTGDLAAAEAGYRTALAIHKDLATPTAIEEVAGLARVALARGNIAAAFEHAQACLAFLDAEGADGIEFPVLVYLTCYDVLSAVGPEHTPAARQALSQAHALLMERASAIEDPATREGMLYNVPLHRRLLEAWAAATG
ncbi:MAG: tetratricopeptide repeat protein [Chloroflexales bacterium]|nr:tetratricopeptide repeat protein [Chloroflexales bacterium]